MVRGHAANDRVAARERVVGQKQHRLAAGRHLQGPQCRAFAGQFAGDGAVQRQLARQAQAHAVGLGRDLPALRGQAGDGLGGEPVGARAHHHVQHHFLLQRGQISRRQLGGGYHAGGWRGLHGQPVAHGHGRGADMGQGVGGAAAHHGRFGKAAAHGDVAACACGGLAHGQHVAIGQGHRFVTWHRPALAVGRGQRQHGIGPGDGHHVIAHAAQLQAAAHGLQRSGVAGIAHQAVGGLEGGLVHGA